MRHAFILAVTLLGLAPLPGFAQSSAAGPSQAALDDALTLGTLATLAPLCRLRDDGWAEDLRRATIQSSTGTRAHDDAGLHAAPGSNLTISALGLAEHEALEDFAETAGGETCDHTAHDPALPRADAMVRDFRRQTGTVEPGS